MSMTNSFLSTSSFISVFNCMEFQGTMNSQKVKEVLFGGSSVDPTDGFVGWEVG